MLSCRSDTREGTAVPGVAAAERPILDTVLGTYRGLGALARSLAVDALADQE
jgi:hypothetical protein